MIYTFEISRSKTLIYTVPTKATTLLQLLNSGCGIELPESLRNGDLHDRAMICGIEFQYILALPGSIQVLVAL